jgi:hypothetical protein
VAKKLINKWQYGDFQTPINLARKKLLLFLNKTIKLNRKTLLNQLVEKELLFVLPMKNLTIQKYLVMK